MDRLKFKGQWNQLKGKAKEQWGDLTDNDLQKIDGEYDQLVGRIQETYGRSREEAEREVEAFARDCGCN